MIGSMIEASALAAEPPPVSLVHELGAGAEACPDEVALRSATIERLRYDPFREDAARTLRTSIRREGDAVVGTLRLEGIGGEVLAEKRLTAPDCVELVAAMALAIAIAVDPAAGVTARVGPPTIEARAASPSIARVDAVSAPAQASSPAPLPDPLRWDAGLGALGTAGAMPRVTAGVVAEVGAARRRWRVALDLRAYLPAEVALQGGTVTISSFTASAAGCSRLFDRLSVCGLVVGGVLSARGHDDLADPSRATTPRAGGGGRVSLDQPLAGPLFLRLQVDGGAWFTRTTLRVGRQEAWAEPAGFAALSLAVLGTIP